MYFICSSMSDHSFWSSAINEMKATTYASAAETCHSQTARQATLIAFIHSFIQWGSRRLLQSFPRAICSAHTSCELHACNETRRRRKELERTASSHVWTVHRLTTFSALPAIIPNNTSRAPGVIDERLIKCRCGFFYQSICDLQDRWAAPSKVYCKLRPTSVTKISFRHFAYLSPNFRRAWEVRNLALMFIQSRLWVAVVSKRKKYVS